MKKLGFLALLFLASPLMAEVGVKGVIPQNISTFTVNGGLYYAHIPSPGTNLKNCITDFTVSYSSSGATFGPATIPYFFAIVQGSPTTGTTIYQVNVSSFPARDPFVKESRSKEEAICSDHNLGFNFVFRGNTVAVDPIITYQGFKRYEP